MPEFRASATYYNIRFSDVVTDPEFSVDILDALRQEAILGPAIIQRNPSAGLVQQLAATPGFANLFDIDLATIVLSSIPACTTSRSNVQVGSIWTRLGRARPLSGTWSWA